MQKFDYSSRGRTRNIRLFTPYNFINECEIHVEDNKNHVALCGVNIRIQYSKHLNKVDLKTKNYRNFKNQKICFTVTFIARCTALKIHNTIAFRRANFYNINEAASHCKYFYESTKQRPSSLVVFFVQWNNHSWNDLQYQSTIISKFWIKIPLPFTRITYAIIYIYTSLKTRNARRVNKLYQIYQ